MHMPLEYPYNDDNNDMPEADQEEANDWHPGSIRRQWPIGQGERSHL